MSYGYWIFATRRWAHDVIGWHPDTGEVVHIGGGHLRDPYGLVVHADRLLIADKINHRILRWSRGSYDILGTRDLSGHRKTRIAGRLHSPGHPTSLGHVNGRGILVTYSADNTIYAIGPDGGLDLVLGIPAGNPGQDSGLREMVSIEDATRVPLRMPTNLAVLSDGGIAFIERGFQIVRVWHPSVGLRCLFPVSQRNAWQNRTEVPALLPVSDYHPAFPTALASDGQGDLFLADAVHRCVWHIPAKGGVMDRVMTADGPGPGGPAALSYGPDGTLWVMDYGSASIVGFRRSGADWHPVPTAAQPRQELQGFRLQGAGLVCTHLAFT